LQGELTLVQKRPVYYEKKKTEPEETLEACFCIRKLVLSKEPLRPVCSII
jgi:hypothetical protein